MDARDVAGCVRPRISLFTISLNHGRYIEETIRSILLQGYPDLEYIVIDGGSADETVEILQRYSKWIAYWVSEKDRSNTHAVNKGLDRVTGQLVNCIPSDDTLMPNALAVVSEAAAVHPNCVIAGGYQLFDEAARTMTTHEQKNLVWPTFLKFWEWDFEWNSVATFLPRTVISRVGRFDEAIPIVSDFEFFCRVLQCAEVRYLSAPLVTLRLHRDALTSGCRRYRMWLGCTKTAKRYLTALTTQERDTYRTVVASRLFAIALDLLKARDREAWQFVRQAFAVSPSRAVLPFLKARWSRLMARAV